MSKMKSLQILIEEVARVALEDPNTLAHIAHELGLDEDELQSLSKYLNLLLDEGSDKP